MSRESDYQNLLELRKKVDAVNYLQNRVNTIENNISKLKSTLKYTPTSFGPEKPTVDHSRSSDFKKQKLENKIKKFWKYFWLLSSGLIFVVFLYFLCCFIIADVFLKDLDYKINIINILGYIVLVLIIIFINYRICKRKLKN